MSRTPPHHETVGSVLSHLSPALAPGGTRDRLRRKLGIDYLVHNAVPRMPRKGRADPEVSDSVFLQSEYESTVPSSFAYRRPARNRSLLISFFGSDTIRRNIGRRRMVRPSWLRIVTSHSVLVSGPEGRDASSLCLRTETTPRYVSSVRPTSTSSMSSHN